MSGIVMAESMVTDFVALGKDIIDQSRISEPVQEESRFYIQQGQVRQYLAEIFSTGYIADGQGNDLLVGIDLIDQLRRYRDDRWIRIDRVDGINWINWVNRVRVDALERQQTCDGPEFIAECACCCDHFQQSGRSSGGRTVAVEQEDGSRCQVVHDCGADLSCSQCSGPVTCIECPTDCVVVSKRAGSCEHSSVRCPHWSAEIRFCACSGGVLDELLKVVEISCQLTCRHLGGIFVTVGMVADFVALGDDVVDQGRVGQSVQEEGGLDVQCRQIRQYLPYVCSIGSIADCERNDFFTGRYLIDHLRNRGVDRITWIAWIVFIYTIQCNQISDCSERVAQFARCSDDFVQGTWCAAGFRNGMHQIDVSWGQLIQHVEGNVLWRERP